MQRGLLTAWDLTWLPNNAKGVRVGKDGFIRLLERCSEYVEHVSRSSLYMEYDFANFDLLEDIENGIIELEEGGIIV